MINNSPSEQFSIVDTNANCAVPGSQPTVFSSSKLLIEKQIQCVLY